MHFAIIGYNPGIIIRSRRLILLSKWCLLFHCLNSCLEKSVKISSSVVELVSPPFKMTSFASYIFGLHCEAHRDWALLCLPAELLLLLFGKVRSVLETALSRVQIQGMVKSWNQCCYYWTRFLKCFSITPASWFGWGRSGYLLIEIVLFFYLIIVIEYLLCAR